MYGREEEGKIALKDVSRVVQGSAHSTVKHCKTGTGSDRPEIGLPHTHTCGLVLRQCLDLSGPDPHTHLAHATHTHYPLETDK